VLLDSKKMELMANMEQTKTDWLTGLKEIEERQVDAMYGVQKAEALVARRTGEMDVANADAAAAQAKLEGVVTAEANAKRALAEEEVALARTVRKLNETRRLDLSSVDVFVYANFIIY
jgi:stress response protein YsnF